MIAAIPAIIGICGGYKKDDVSIVVVSQPVALLGLAFLVISGHMHRCFVR